ncbi:MAG TPA: serine--tRNA ligase [Gemmatimonadota bacterium]|jgi:seryl-tRNA synthetase|nr:serine--tRNA ligase [Gemmatimonadota bacterium]
MLDVRILREDRDRLREGLARRGDSADVDRLVRLDEEYRRLLAESERLKAERNARSKDIGAMVQGGRADEAEELKSEMRVVSDRIKSLDDQSSAHKETLDSLLLELPNLPHASVPAGGAEANVQVREWGRPRAFDFEPKPHWELGERLGILDLERATKIAGSGFVGLTGAGAALSRALIAFMLDRHLANGYREIAPPYLVNSATATATGHLPKFEEQLYACDRDELYLIPTAEVPIMGWHREEILDADALPLRYCAHTPCFRREAGAAGRETRGMIRVHQFDKVEMVAITTPETSYDLLETLTADAEAVLQALELPYRVLLLAAGDMGNAAAKTFDIEAWAPGVGMWLEVSSCSNCESYQARRADLRMRAEGASGTRHPHTLNGSGVALPRTMIALLENGQNADGTVTLPAALRPYMGGREVLEPGAA